MVILHTETLKKWGGEQNRVLVESIGLRDRGHNVIIACHKGSMLAQKAKEAGLKVHEVNMVKQAYLFTIPKLVKIIKKENVDIVSTHSSVDSWAGGIAAKLTGRKLVRFRHNIYKIGKDPMTRFIYKIPNKIICISDEVKKTMINCGIAVKNLVVINSSVDTDRFNPENAKGLNKNVLPLPEKAVVIGNTSSFAEVKGQIFLLKAFNIIARQKPCYLLFACRLADNYKVKYLEFVEPDLRNNVIFLGHRDDIPSVIKSLDIFVFPSFVEGLGTALIEAMAMRKPVVVSDIPTFRNFIEDRTNGIFFRPRDPEDLALKVISLLGDNELKRKIGLNAQRTVYEKFSLKNMLDTTEKLYIEMLGARQDNQSNAPN